MEVSFHMLIPCELAVLCRKSQMYNFDRMRSSYQSEDNITPALQMFLDLGLYLDNDYCVQSTAVDFEVRSWLSIKTSSSVIYN